MTGPVTSTRGDGDDTVTRAPRRPRTQASADRMSEHEALMWNIEKDPWLNPSGAALVLTETPIDLDRFRHTMRHAVANLPRLMQRVTPGFGRISTPAWSPDPEFDLDHHLRHVTLPAPGTRRQLFDLAAQLYQDPLDRTRPLWRFVVIDGLEDGGGALWMLTHHAVSDGIGQIRMAELYQDTAADAPPAPDVDLDAVLAEAIASHTAKEQGGDLAIDLRSTITKSTGHLVRRQLGLSRRLMGELAIWPADPSRVVERVGDLTTLAQGTVGQLVPRGEAGTPGSPLFANRSRHRHLEHVVVPLDRLKAAAKANGATINDAFLAAMGHAVVAYHQDRGVELETLHTSFVVSTRTDHEGGGNAFTPVPVSLDGRAMTLAERLIDTNHRLAEAREAATRSGGVTALSGIANLLPTSVVTKAARSQAARIDFATSNLRSAPFPLYVGGARIVGTVPMGPLAGTPCNATAMSAENRFDIGLFIDPSAIDAPDDFRRCVADAFDELLSLT